MLVRPKDPLFAFEPPAHPLIRASRVCGAAALARDGRRLGRLKDVAIEKATGRVAYALLDAGKQLGSQSALHPAPWSRLR